MPFLNSELSSFTKAGNIPHQAVLGSNQKTEKNHILTATHNLSPAGSSGVIDVCPGAGFCAKLCLHYAGNPAFMKGKASKRQRQTVAFAANPELYVENLALALCRQVFRNSFELSAFRPNTTSDIVWEDVNFTLSIDSAQYIRHRYKIETRAGYYESIFHFIQENSLPIVCYDYTKLKRDWAKCQSLGYHLTASYDGNLNTGNHKICRDAIANGVNVAVAFNVKRGHNLPQYVDDFLGIPRRFDVIDGDLTDARFADNVKGQIIGLRFKHPRSIPHTNADILNFCYS